MTYTYISTQDALDCLATKPSQEKPTNLSVDTEFVRKTTYWPKLCLIQLCFSGQTYIIDALSKIDLTPLKPCFDDKTIRKIFHSGRQDVEIFYRLWGVMPKNIADTQILGMVTGFGESVSYEKLCDATLRKKLDKSQQHTDWGKRPLSQRQLDYAATDVVDLEKIYEKLVKGQGKKLIILKKSFNGFPQKKLTNAIQMQLGKKSGSAALKKPFSGGVSNLLPRPEKKSPLKQTQPEAILLKTTY
ncbi:MAG: ribonuclease D [Holosporaceae bacterium]|nr:MAG: ribonuclease D [Holosporaceae bacterium]